MSILKPDIMVKMCPLILLLSVSLAFATPCQAQTKIVNGVVYTLNDLPVANLEIVAKKSGASVKSDSTGSFSIACADKDMLLFQGKVFKEKRVKVGGKTDWLEVELTFINTEENKEYAIGYGYVSSEDKLNSAVQITDRNVFCTYSNIFDAIEGRFNNVQVSEGCVVIRGATSFNHNSCAIYVVDGQNVESISSIDPCMVKSIDIIKDGTSAIYGMQGANGVIIIDLIKSIE